MTTTIVAWLGLVLAALSLGWNIVSFLRTGSRPLVTADSGVSWATYPGSPMNPFLAIEVVNRGRTATSVTGFGFITPTKQIVGAFESYTKPVALPARLEPGETLSFWFEPAELRRRGPVDGYDPLTLRPYARVGGKLIPGKWINDKRRRSNLAPRPEDGAAQSS